MIIIRSFWVMFAIFCLLANSYAAGSKQNAAFRSFWQPLYHGDRLAYCFFGTNKCGRAVADQYCRLMGYHYASQEIKAPNVGLTTYLGTTFRCKGWQCNGFMTISCATSISHKPPKSYHYTDKRFVFPRMNQYRVDWCYRKNRGCGYRAADSFCKRLGYTNAKKFRRDPQIEATKTVGSQELCFGKLCKGFKYIICHR